MNQPGCFRADFVKLSLFSDDLKSQTDSCKKKEH